MSQLKKRVLILGGNSYIAKSFINFCANMFEFNIIKRNKEFFDYYNIEERHFKDVDIVINFTAIVHKKNIERKVYFDVNSKLALLLAKKAKSNEVGHFIQLSSIAVYGDATKHINFQTQENPSSHYGESKQEADIQLRELISKKFIVSIIRPPMVYGIQCPGNMHTLLRVIGTHLPLPLKVFSNKRSFVYIDNLSSAIEHVINSKINGIFLVKNQEDVSIGRLSTEIKNNLGSKNILFPFPVKFLSGCIENSKLLKKLYGNLTIDDTLTIEKIGCYSVVGFEDSISEMIKKREN